jgi:SAM-dependent methyltransferase
MKFKLSRSYNWLIYKVVNPQLAQRMATCFKGRLLDIGCGEKPYLQMAAPFVEEHQGMDWDGTIHDRSAIDLFGTAYKIPVAAESFDSVLCTYVLEHLEEPARAVAEAYRVLKPGGYALYTVPFYWHLHEEPHDYFRFTKYGLQSLFEKSGFEVVEIKAVSGFFVTFGQEASYWLQGLRRGGRRNPLWWLLPPFGHLVQAAAYLLHKLGLDRSERFTIEYIAVVKKPGQLVGA